MRGKMLTRRLARLAAILALAPSCFQTIAAEASEVVFPLDYVPHEETDAEIANREAELADETWTIDGCFSLLTQGRTPTAPGRGRK